MEIEYNPVPNLTRLLQNYPNPFNPETWIPYQLSQDSEVKVWIYDVGGQLVRSMEVGFREAGTYISREKAIYWDRKSQDGERVASGVYFYSLKLDAESQSRRMVILKWVWSIMSDNGFYRSLSVQLADSNHNPL